MKLANRNIEIDFRKASGKSRTVPVVLSSEKPYDRGEYIEVLQHRQDAIDLEREPLPLIESHDGGQVNIGLVENLRIDNGKLRGSARFGNSSRANELWLDIEAGIVRNVSIGYQVLEWESDKTGYPPTMTITRWKPFECSIVSIPADETVGFYRNQIQEKSMKTATQNSDDHLTRSEEKSARDAIAYDKNRIAAIRAMAEEQKLEALGERFIASGASYEDFNAAGLEIIGDRNRNARTDYPGSDTNGHNTDISSRSFINEFSGRKLDSFHGYLAGACGLGEFDVGPYRERSQELSRLTGRKPRQGGILFPLGDMKSRALTITAAGGATMEEAILAGSFIDVLRAKSIIMNLNPTMINGLVGDATIPRKTASTTGYWVNLDDVETITESTVTIDQVNLNFKSLAAFTKYSHKMLVQSSLSVEQMIREDLATTLAVALDRAAIQGTGSAGQPTGVTNASGINTVASAAATPTFAEVVKMEGEILSDNVDLSGSMAYLTTPALSTTLKSTPVVTDSDTFVWQSSGSGEGQMNGYRAFATSNVPAGKTILGKWSDLIIGTWSVLEILVDPYSDIQKATVGVRVLMDVDIGIRHPESFCVMTEAE